VERSQDSILSGDKHQLEQWCCRLAAARLRLLTERCACDYSKLQAGRRG